MKRFNQINRILSFVLAIVMIFGMMPVFAHAAETDEVIDTAIIFTDLHTSKSNYKESNIKDSFTVLKNAGLPISLVVSGGDAFSVNEDSGKYTGDTSKITGYIHTALGDTSIPVHYVWSDHDRYGTNIDKNSGFVYGAGDDGIYGNADDDNYYVYSLSMADLSTNDRYKAGFHSNSAITATIAAFEADAAELDQSKPLLITSHQPLFDRRDDNGHALEWCNAINRVAENMDVAFFFGHNHRHDKAEDYYYAKGSTMPVATSSLSSQNVTLNFTHMCAGYMEPTSTGSTSNTTRSGVLMVVQIMENAVRYTTYNKNGIYTGNYAVDKTVTRDHAVTEPELVISGPDTYFVGEALNLTVSVKTGSKVEDVTAQAAVTGFNMNAAGAYTVTASYNGMTAQYPIAVYQKSFAASGATVEVTKPGATALTVTSATADAEPMLMNYVGYNINLTGYTQGDGAVVTLPVPAGVTKPAVCHVADGKIVKVNATVSGNTVSFTTDVFGTFLVGQEGISENLEQSVTAGGTSYEEKIVYVKATSFENGGKYLLVGEDKATNGNKIAYVNNNGKEAWVIVTPNAEGQIELDNANAIWTASGDAKNGYSLINGNYAIGRGKDAETLRNKDQALKVTYDADAARLKTASGTTRYLYYSTHGTENWKWATSSSSSTSSRNMWIYKQETVRVNVSVPVIYTVQASNLTHVQGEKTAQLQYNLLADGAAAALPAGAAYNFQPVNDINGIIASISNTGLITFNQVSGSCYVKIACTLNEGTAYKYVKVTTEVENPVCEHSYEASVTKEPTCVEEGVKTYTCTKCGDSYTESVATVDHVYESVVTAPTCTEAGYTTYTCTVCGDSHTGNQVAALGHDYKATVTKEPTCSEEGTKIHTCTKCGDSYTESVATVDHAYEAVETVAPTCSEAGYTVYTCAVCGDSYVGNQVAALGHKNVSVVTEPTCTEQGYTTHTCTVCGQVTVDSYVEPAHNLETIISEGSCEADAFHVDYCLDCDYEYVWYYIEATGHNYAHEVVNGWNVYTCTVCGDSYSDEVVITYSRVNTISNDNAYVMTIVVNNQYCAVSHKNNTLTLVPVVVRNSCIDTDETPVTEDMVWEYSNKKLSYESSDGRTYYLYAAGNNKALTVSTSKSSTVTYTGNKLKIGSYYLRYYNDKIVTHRTAGQAFVFLEG